MASDTTLETELLEYWLEVLNPDLEDCHRLMTLLKARIARLEASNDKRTSAEDN